MAIAIFYLISYPAPDDVGEAQKSETEEAGGCEVQTLPNQAINKIVDLPRLCPL